MKPRVLTQEEVRDLSLKHCRQTADYWVTLPNNSNNHQDEIRRRVEGAIFSILVALDGDAMALPGFKVIPDPHQDDKDYCKDRGMNWLPNDVDIAGALHSTFYNRK